MRNGNGGKLNADWVERMMGYPDGWTDIEKDAVDSRDKYPAAWLNGSWDTIPRIVAEQRNRRKRMAGTGNAVVPQTARYLWGLVKAAYENNAVMKDDGINKEKLIVLGVQGGNE
jgi:hypothetical protein